MTGNLELRLHCGTYVFISVNPIKVFKGSLYFSQRIVPKELGNAHGAWVRASFFLKRKFLIM